MCWVAFSYNDSKNHSVVLELTQQLQDSGFEPQLIKSK